MARIRVYLKSFLENGEYAPDFTEITNDVISVGAIQLGLENTEYDVGFAKTGGVAIVLRNDGGKYSEPDNPKSIFDLKRKNSIIKITWDVRDYDLICGFFQCGVEPLGGEEEVFRGVINEVSSVSDIDKQQAKFTVLGFESLLNEMGIPASIAGNEAITQAVYECLNQAPFNELVTVDLANFSSSTNPTLETLVEFANKTVGEVLKDLCLMANAVVYLKNNTVYMSTRDGSVDLKYTFYGQASILGVENIIGVPNYKDGMNRTFNYWQYQYPGEDSINYLEKDDTSIELYGIRKKQLNSKYVVSEVKVRATLEANLAEFAFPRVELELQTPIWYSTLQLQILDKVQIDYPTIYVAADSNVLPRYGLSNYGVQRYPFGQWSLTITNERRWKIINKKVDIAKQIITFQLREMDI